MEGTAGVIQQFSSQSRRLPLLQVVSNNKSFSVGVQSPTEINAPRVCAVILRRICQLSLTRITPSLTCVRLEKKGYRIYGRIKNIAGGVCL